MELKHRVSLNPVSDSQSDKFSFNITVLFYYLDFFEKNECLECFYSSEIYLSSFFC